MPNQQYIDVEIDKLTNSIENIRTGDSFPTDILLVAFAARLSFHRGFEGYISFLSKTTSVEHYIKTLGASHVGGNVMVISGS